VYVSVCVCVCLSVRQDSSGTTHAIFTDFSVLVAYGRGSVLRQSDEIPRGRGTFGGFLPHCNAFAAKGIIRLRITSCSRRDDAIFAVFPANGIDLEGGDGSAQCG